MQINKILYDKTWGLVSEKKNEIDQKGNLSLAYWKGK